MSECVKRVSLHSQVIVKTRQKSATIFSTGGQAVFSKLIKSMSSVIYRCFSQWVKLLPRGGFRFLAKGQHMVKRESMCLCQGVKILQKGVTTVSKGVQHMVKGVIVFMSRG